MTSVRLRTLAALLALAPAAVLLAGSPAQATPPPASPGLPTVKSVTASKTSFVLGAKAACSKLTFTAVLSAVMPSGSEYEFTGVGVDLYKPGQSDEDDSFDGIDLPQVGTSTTYKGSINFCGKYTPGTWKAEVYGATVSADETDIKFTNTKTVSISLKRPSTVSFNASPEPVKKGKTITAAGTLKFDGKVASKATVKIYFKATGAKAYTLKSTVVTTTKGYFNRKYKATTTGTWKVTYPGSSTHNTVTKGDTVKVTK